jgi:hypothetical protein
VREGRIYNLKIVSEIEINKSRRRRRRRRRLL